MNVGRQTQLRKLLPDEVPTGRALPFDLLDEMGHVFKRAGQVLKPVDLKRYHRRLRAGVFVDAAHPQAPPTTTSARQVGWMSRLEPGQHTEQDIYDANGVLLLARGSRINERFLRTIKYRQIKLAQPAQASPSRPAAVAAPEVDDAPSEPDYLRQLDRVLLDQQSLPARRKTTAVATPRLALQDLREQVEAGVEAYRQAVEMYAAIACDAMAGSSPNLRASNELVKRVSTHISQDASLAMLLMQLGEMPGGEYLFHHGMNVAMLAMRVASQLGYDAAGVHDAGVAAMLQDIGMLDVPDDIRLARRSLSSDERFEIEQHTAHTVNRLHKAQGISQISLLIAYQSHERCDRSGYPRKRHSSFIHPLARVVHAADVFAAVTCDRPHRRGKSPHQGILAVLHEARAGRIDRDVARAMLDCAGIFPVGSYVRLSDGQAARVIRSNEANPLKPVVVPLNRDGTEAGDELNLARADSLSVTAALLASEATGRRVAVATIG